MLVAVPVALYLGDFAVVSLRGTPTSTVLIKQYYAVPQKGNKIQYLPADPGKRRVCFKSLFPHARRPALLVRKAAHPPPEIDM